VCVSSRTKQKRVPLVEQELLTRPDPLSSPPIFSGFKVTRSLVVYVCFVNRCLSFWSFCHGVNFRVNFHFCENLVFSKNFIDLLFKLSTYFIKRHFQYQSSFLGCNFIFYIEYKFGQNKVLILFDLFLISHLTFPLYNLIMLHFVHILLI